jgi:hypothetical protein
MRTQKDILDILRSGDHVPSWPPHWTPRTHLLSIGLIEKLFSVSTSTDRDLKRFSVSPMLQCLIPSMMAGSSRYHFPESSIKLIFREILQWHWQVPGGLLAGSVSNGFGSPAVSMHLLISGDSRVVCTAGNVERGGSQIRVPLLQTRHSDESSYSSPAAVDCRTPQHRQASKTVIGLTAIPYPLPYTTVRSMHSEIHCPKTGISLLCCTASSYRAVARRFPFLRPSDAEARGRLSLSAQTAVSQYSIDNEYLSGSAMA